MHIAKRASASRYLESIYETPRELVSARKEQPGKADNHLLQIAQSSNMLAITAAPALTTQSQEALLNKLIQKQQSITLQQLKQKKLEGEK